MKNLIIDAGKNKIFFSLISNGKSYTSEYINNRKNFDRLVLLLFEFLNSKSIKINQINNIFVNQGIGKFSGIQQENSWKLFRLHFLLTFQWNHV